jgi:SET domain-containing protein
LEFNWLNPKAEMRHTPGKGSGSFAIEKINKGEVIASFGGFVVEKENLKNYSEDRVARSLQLNKNKFLLSGPNPEPGDMLNHSCEPNCGAIGTSSICAIKDIYPETELTFDYAMTDSSQYDEFNCACKTNSCRQKITGEDWKNSIIQQKYEGYFSSYLKKLINFS